MQRVGRFTNLQLSMMNIKTGPWGCQQLYWWNNFKDVDITTWRELKQSQPHYIYKVDNDKFSFAPVKLKGRFDFHNLQLHKTNLSC